MTTILIVEDRLSNRKRVVAMLAAGRHRFLEAADGTEALELARSEHPSLIITDILLPTMDGAELVRRLRLDPEISPTPPVIFLTAHYHLKEALTLASSCGVAGVLVKPGDEPDDRLPDRGAELERTNERLSATIELGLRLGAELDPRRLLRSFCHSARELLGARAAIVGVADSDGQQLRHLFTSGMDAESTARLGSPNPSHGPFKVLFSDNRPLRLQNANDDPVALGFPPEHPNVHTWLGAPIASPGTVFGFIGLIDKLGAETFSDDDERLASELAALVGRLYQAASLYADAQKHAGELVRELEGRERAEQRNTIVLAVSRTLAESATLIDACHRVLGAICSHLGWELGAIWLLDQASNMLHCTEVWQSPARRFPESEAMMRALELSPGAVLPGRVFIDGVPAMIADVTRAPMFQRAEITAKEGLRSAFSFPIKLGEQSLGTVELFSVRAREPDQDLLDISAAISGPLALFIERKQHEESLARAHERLRAVIAASPVVLFTLRREDDELVTTWISESVRELLGCAPNEALRARWWNDSIHPADRERMLTKLREVEAAGRASDEHRVLHADGTYRCLSCELRLTEQGEIAGTWSSVPELRVDRTQPETFAVD